MSKPHCDRRQHRNLTLSLLTISGHDLLLGKIKILNLQSQCFGMSQAAVTSQAIALMFICISK